MRVTDYLSAIGIGIVIGVLGRLVLPGRQRIGAVVTVLIGVGAALLGAFLAHLFGIDGDHAARLWRLRWDWVVLAVQVGLAVIGVGLANALTHTRLAEGEPAPRRRSVRRRTKASSSD